MKLDRVYRVLCVLGVCAAAGCNAGTDDRDAGRADGATRDVVTHEDGGAHDADAGGASDAGGRADASADAATFDVGLLDTGGSDATAGRDTGSAPDGGNTIVPACAEGAVVDLLRDGTRTGATTDYAGSNEGAPESGPFLPPPGCTGAVGFAQPFRYTTFSRAHLRVSTDNAGTDPLFDTVVWVQDRCDPLGATALGCNDDGSSLANDHASTLTTPDPLPAGSTVYVLLAGFDPPVVPLVAHGAFELTVTEVPDALPGDGCDPAGLASFCARGSSCALDPASGSTPGANATPTCVPDGHWGGHCAAGNACDAGLACDARTMRCVQPVADNSPCDPSGASTRCVAAGSSCVPMGTMAFCLPDGAKNGRCRTAGYLCDPGLLCSGPVADPASRCRTAAAQGAACDPSGQGAICTPPDGCQPASDGSGGGVCAPRYALATNVPAGWIDACSVGSEISLAGDDTESGVASSPVTVPFAFEFFGTPRGMLWPAVDGVIGVGDAPPDAASLFPTQIPDADAGALVAPLRADLSLADGGAICAASVGAAPDRRLVIEWSGARVAGSSGPALSFEAVLEESTSAIAFVYLTGAPGGADSGVPYAAAGLQSDHARESVVARAPMQPLGALRFVPRY